MKTVYSRDFYQNMDIESKYAANIVLSILLDRIPKIYSAIDIGSGVGTWLATLKEKKVPNILGVDGGWVDQDLLVIPKDSFMSIDLSRTLQLPGNYDLAISLEVAEHLPPDRAENFVSILTSLSDLVLFSAAIPFQGGLNHINEQWPDYWAKLFLQKDYDVYDFIRPKIWNNNKIDFWYRQNILLYAKRNVFAGTKIYPVNLENLNVVHPDLYLSIASKADAEIGVKQSARIFYKSIKSYITRKLRK